MKSEPKKRILLKLSGRILTNESGQLHLNLVHDIAKQIESLKNSFYFAIVIGGGNFFRGIAKSKELKISEQTSHYVGMLATCMNGLILQDVFSSNNINCTLLSDLNCQKIGKVISINSIKEAIERFDSVIFSGGTGNPYFTTDTTSIIRSLQIEAHEVWKCTDVNGIYTKDPKKFSDAKLLSEITYKQAIEQDLNIMDGTAFTLAKQYKMPIRIFNIFDENALINASVNAKYGSIVL